MLFRRVLLGPRIASGVTLAARAIPDHSAITAPHTAEAHVRQRPARRTPRCRNLHDRELHRTIGSVP